MTSLLTIIFFCSISNADEQDDANAKGLFGKFRSKGEKKEKTKVVTLASLVSNDSIVYIYRRDSIHIHSFVMPHRSMYC